MTDMGKFKDAKCSVVNSFVIIVLLTLPNCYSLKSQVSSVTSTEDGIDNCPPWYSHNTTKNCVCQFTHNLKGIIYQAENDRCLSQKSTMLSPPSLQIGYCMTFKNESRRILLVRCPYNTVLGHDHQLNKLFVILNTTVSNLNNFTCEPLNREDELCSKCKDRFGPSPLTLDLSCFDCSRRYHGLPLYLTLEILPLTVFFIIVTALKIRPSHGYLNSFVLLSQVIAALLSFSSQVPFIYSMGPMSNVSLILVRTLQTVYGFWNLDFFRYLIPGFCVSSTLSNLDVLMLQLISVFYPMSLIVVAWASIHLYESNFRPFIWVWRPFRRCLSHFSVTNNPKKTVVNLFTTFLLLSYTKILFVAANLLNTVKVLEFDPYSTPTKLIPSYKSSLFLDPTIRYSSSQNAPYVFTSFFLFAVFILPPPLILLLYPTTWFQKFLNCCCPKSRTIRIFAHACHGCFKNGLNGTRDCRHFAGAYLLLRIALFLCKTGINSTVAQWAMISFCFGTATVLIALYRPYRNSSLNALDFFFMLSFSISSLFAAFVTTTDPKEHKNKLVPVVFGIIFLCSLLPLIYISCLMIYYIKKRIKRLKHFLILRRRDYLDISDFQYDPESSDVMDQGHTANILRSRVLNSDSFQSE